MNTCNDLNSFCNSIGLGERITWKAENQCHFSKERFDNETALCIADILRAALDVPEVILGVSTDYSYGTYAKATNTRVIIRSLEPIKKIERAYAAFISRASDVQNLESLLALANSAPPAVQATITKKSPWVAEKLESVHSLLKKGHFLYMRYDRLGGHLVGHITPAEVQFIQTQCAFP